MGQIESSRNHLSYVSVMNQMESSRNSSSYVFPDKILKKLENIFQYILPTNLQNIITEYLAPHQHVNCMYCIQDSNIGQWCKCCICEKKWGWTCLIKYFDMEENQCEECNRFICMECVAPQENWRRGDCCLLGGACPESPDYPENQMYKRWPPPSLLQLSHS